MKILIDFDQIDCNKYVIISQLFSFGFPLEIFSNNENHNKFIISSKNNIETYGVLLTPKDFVITSEIEFDYNTKYIYVLPPNASKLFIEVFLLKLFTREKIYLPLDLQKELESKYITYNDFSRDENYFSYNYTYTKVHFYKQKHKEVRKLLEKYNPNTEEYMVSRDGLYYIKKYCNI